jgi:acyl-CoA synthetase (AMP-forming)/AMP-acid ligase II
VNRPKTITEIIGSAAREKPNNTALVYSDRSYSYRELDEITDRIAANLFKTGIRKDSKVGINGPNIPEWLFSYIGLCKLGAVAVALNIRYRETELDYMLNQSDTCCLISVGLLKSPFGDFDFREYYRSLRPRFPNLKRYIFVGGGGGPDSEAFEELLTAPSEADKADLSRAKTAVRPDDPAMIIYTSGTTGKPKGALITHKSQIASAYGQLLRVPIDERDSLVAALPLNHVGGITTAVMYMLMARAKIILQPFFIPSEMVKLCHEHQTTVMGGVTTMFSYIFRDPGFRPEMLKNIRITITGGANVGPELMEQIGRFIPRTRVINSYGLTECSGGVVQSTLEDDHETLLHSVGKPIEGQTVRIVDEKLRNLPPGETGELFIEGDSVAAGYYRWPQATQETFMGGGVRTGDMGFVDDRGYVYLKGRKKEMYIQGGYNIYPAEIENVLSRHPGVSMAAGIGVPDPVMGEIGRFYILPSTGADVTSEELTAYLKEHLANYKIPRQFVFVDELPLTPAGKVQKSALKEQYDKTGK